MLGAIAGFCTLVGVAILIRRRRTTGPVFMATTRNDKLMYLVLVAGLAFQLDATADTVHGVDLTLARSSRIAVTGPSGAGESRTCASRVPTRPITT